MTRSGKEYIEGLRDGRRVYADGDLVEDVTDHPGFAGAVRSVASLYDLVNAAENQGRLTFRSPETGDWVNYAFLIPESTDDLTRRRQALRAMSEVTYGLLGRSPEHVAGFLAGFAGGSHVFEAGEAGAGERIRRFHAHARDNDLYVTYTIMPPQIDRSQPAHRQDEPFLYAGVKEVRDDGIILSGAQMLGTGTAISDYVYVSNIAPLKEGEEDYAFAAVVPIAAPGVRVHARRPYAMAASSVFDYPLTSMFDEGDSLVIFDDVFVPIEHVFAYRNRDVVRRQWDETPAHVLGNNQAQIRFWTKLEFLLGLTYRMLDMTGTIAAPPVKGELGRLASKVATVRGLVFAQESNSTVDEHGVAWPGVEECYANIAEQADLYNGFVALVRELVGGGVIQLPSSNNDFEHADIRADLDRYVRAPGYDSQQRVKLSKLLWDVIGSEFASRHTQYEMFYAGAPFVTRMRMFSSFDFAPGEGMVDRMLGSYDLDGLR